MSVIDRPLIQRPRDNDKIRSQRVVWACGISHKPAVSAPKRRRGGTHDAGNRCIILCTFFVEKGERSLYAGLTP